MKTKICKSDQIETSDQWQDYQTNTKWLNTIHLTSDDALYIGIDTHKASFHIALWLNDAAAIDFVTPSHIDKLLNICEDPLLYFLQSSVHSQKDQPVDFLCQDNTQYILLNGEMLPDKKGNLKKGDNNLVLVYNSRRGVYGALLRLADPHSGRRLTDIRFEPEKVEAGLTGVFKPYWSTNKTKSLSE